MMVGVEDNIGVRVGPMDVRSGAHPIKINVRRTSKSTNAALFNTYLFINST